MVGAYNDTEWYVIEPMAFWKAACVATVGASGR